jgi:RNA polymerase sigma factor (sigma-70 family)
MKRNEQQEDRRVCKLIAEMAHDELAGGEEQKSLERFTRLAEPRIRGWLHSANVRTQDIDSAFYDALNRVWHGAKNFRKRKNVPAWAWVCKIATRAGISQVRQYIRAEARQAELESDEELPDERLPLVDRRAELRNKIDLVLDRLPPRWQRVIRLHLDDRLDHAAIKDIMELKSESASRMLLYRAIKKARKIAAQRIER